MDLNEIKLAGWPHQHHVRVGRGPSSGLGQTSGRGTKGFHSRQGHKIGQITEGSGSQSLYRRSPKRGFNHKVFDDTKLIINLADLVERFKDGEEVTLETLHEKKIRVPKSKYDLRLVLLGRLDPEQQLPKNLKIKLHRISKTAQEAIQKANGTVEVIKLKKAVRNPKNKKVE